MKVQCKKEVVGTKGDILFDLDSIHDADMLEKEGIRVKDNIGCIRTLDKSFVKEHFITLI